MTLIFDGEVNLFEKYLDVEVEYNDDIRVNKLSDFLQGEEVQFMCDISDTATITIRYILAIDAGNELQGVKSDFNILFISER